MDGLKLKNWLVEQCHSLGIKKPTSIQANCIPRILEGQNCIGISKTGSGKTLAFALPIIDKLDDDPHGFFALVLTVTRELACQIADQFSVMGKPRNLKVCTVIGGMDYIEQGRQLAKLPHIVVATPGRLVDHLQGGDPPPLSRVKFLVFDEADRLCGGMFDEAIKLIGEACGKSPKRQYLFFSATFSSEIKAAISYMKDREPFIYEDKTPDEIATVSTLTQEYLLCPLDYKDCYLVELLRVYRESDDIGNIIIFTDTCKHCQVLSITLNELGFENVALHGMLRQKERIAALNKFKNNQIKILICTDVAARGLDIPTVKLVINHNVPKIPKEYIHRVGRTARAGRGGRAVTVMTPYDIKLVLAIEELIKTKLTEVKVDDKKVSEIILQVQVTRSEARLKLDETNFYEKKLTNMKKKWIMEGLDPEEEEYKLLNKRKLQAKKKAKEKVKHEALEVTEDELKQKLADVRKKEEELNKQKEGGIGIKNEKLKLLKKKKLKKLKEKITSKSKIAKRDLKKAKTKQANLLGVKKKFMKKNKFKE